VKTSGAGTNLDGDVTNDGNGGATLTSDAQPLGDVCSSRDAVELAGANVGDLLNDAGVTWGFFQGGFDLTLTNANGTTGCGRTSASALVQATKTDYIPHHQPFQYYASTRNTTHARPSSVEAIGHSFEADGKTPDPANHQYDIHDFVDALQAGNFPAVSYLKAPGYQDGHAGYSTPIDEQVFVVDLVNLIQQSPEWSTTAIMIQYDDSDGWYDHQMSPIVNPSTVSAATASVTLNSLTVAGNPDALNGDGLCNVSIAQQGGATPATPLLGSDGKAAQGRCGYGPRLPFLVISPYAKKNYIDHTLTDQTSSLRFIEDNWLSKQRIEGSFDAIAGDITSANSMLDFAAGPVNGPLFLNPVNGTPETCPTCL
jgi:phospholipase C